MIFNLKNMSYWTMISVKFFFSFIVSGIYNYFIVAKQAFSNSTCPYPMGDSNWPILPEGSHLTPTS